MMNSVYLNSPGARPSRDTVGLPRKRTAQALLLGIIAALLLGVAGPGLMKPASQPKAEGWDIIKALACSDFVNGAVNKSMGPETVFTDAPKRVYQATQTSDVQFQFFSKSAMAGGAEDVGDGLNGLLETANTKQGGRTYKERNETVLGGATLNGSKVGNPGAWNTGPAMNPYDRFGLAGLRFSAYGGEWKHLFIDACADVDDTKAVGDQTVSTSPDTSLLITVATWNVCSSVCTEKLLALQEEQTDDGESYLWPQENFAWPFRAALGASREIAELQPDIVGIQESTHSKDETDTVLMAGYEVVDRKPARIYYKPEKFTVLDHGVEGLKSRISACTTATKTKWISWAKFRVKDGREMGFINTHLLVNDRKCATSNDPQRKKQTDALLKIAREKLAGVPTVIVGDYNSTKGDLPDKAMKKTGYKEVYDDNLATDIIDGNFSTYQGEKYTQPGTVANSGYHIDRIYVSPVAGPEKSGPMMGVGQYRIYAKGGFPPSDHALVFSSVNISGPYVAQNGDPNDPRTNLFYDTRLEPRATWEDIDKSIDPRTVKFADGLETRYFVAMGNNVANFFFLITKIIVGATLALIALAFSDLAGVLGLTAAVGGSGGSGGLFGQLYQSLFLPLSVLAFLGTAVYVAWQGIVKRAFRNALGGLVKSIACFIIAIIIAANPAWFIALPNNAALVSQSLIASILNQGLIGKNGLCESSVGTEVLPVKAGDNETFTEQAGDNTQYVSANPQFRADPESAQEFLQETAVNVNSSIGCSLWNVFLFTPWVEGQFGQEYSDLDMSKLGNRNGPPKATGEKAWVGEPEVPMGGGKTIKNWALFQLSTQTNAHSAYAKPGTLSAYSQGVAHDWWRIVDALSNYQEEEKTMKVEYPTSGFSDGGGGAGVSGTDLVVSGKWTFPVKNPAIGTPFGKPGGAWSSGFHTGTDYPKAAGTPIYAAGAGKVTFRGWGGAYGNQVRIKHGGGVSTTYSHMSAFGVSNGATVKAGTFIGKVGNTGNSFGPHLHFEMNVPCGTAGARKVYGECKIDGGSFLKSKATGGSGGGGGATAAPTASVWDRLAKCETGGNWRANTGNGYYGGVQFSLATWKAMGGKGLPSNASKAEQISRATKLQKQSGWGQWPACSKKLGLTNADSPDSGGAGPVINKSKNVTYISAMDPKVLDAWDNWTGTSPSHRIFTAVSSMLVALLGVAAPLGFAALSAIYALGIVILMAFAPIFFLAGCWAGRGWELFTAWGSLVITTTLRRIAAGALMMLSLALTSTMIQLMQSQGWFKGVILMAIVSVVLWKMKDKIINAVRVNLSSVDLTSSADKTAGKIKNFGMTAGRMGTAITAGGIMGAAGGAGNGDLGKGFAGGSMAAFKGEWEKLSYRSPALRSMYHSIEDVSRTRKGQASMWEGQVDDNGHPLIGGQVWEHKDGRILCGDCVSRMMSSEQASMDDGWVMVEEMVRPAEELRINQSIYNNKELRRARATAEKGHTFDTRGNVAKDEYGNRIVATEEHRKEELTKLVSAVASETSQAMFNYDVDQRKNPKDRNWAAPAIPEDLKGRVDERMVELAWELKDDAAIQAIQAQYVRGWINWAEDQGIELDAADKARMLEVGLEAGPDDFLRWSRES